MKLVSVAEMRAIERAADVAGLSYVRMMANAGHSLAEAISRRYVEGGLKIVALVGTGNNGGDALGALAELARKGWKANFYIEGKRGSDKYVAAAKKAGATQISSHSSLRKQLSKADIVIDGVLGTGVRLPLREGVAATLRLVGEAIAERTDKPGVVAVDCPSGMDCDSGQVAAETLKADMTVTMAAAKMGMLTMPAFEYIGELVVGHIGLSEDLKEWKRVHRFVIDEAMTQASLPERPLSAHKGTFGTAMIVAGSRRFPGAALLSGEAAFRSGAGLVTIATVESMQPSMAGHLREATWLPLAEDAGWIAESAAETIDSQLERVTAMLVGPGLGTQEGTRAFVHGMLKRRLPRLVVDADGLKLLAQIPNWHQLLPKESVLTPHPGEMAILTGLDVSAIQPNRWAIAEKYAKEWGHVVVLKGAFTVVAGPNGMSATLPLATPALARAGTGDVLAGIVTGLVAQRVEAYDAACAAVWLHGDAALRAAQLRRGTAGVLAGDLIRELRA